MNKKILLPTLGLGICGFILSGFNDGPAHHGAGNRSGSAGSTNCSVCHGGAIDSNLILGLTFTDDADNSIITNEQYTPGHTYTVQLKGNHPGDSAFSQLGFQASVINAAGSNTGTLSTASANTETYDAGNINVIEHIAPLDKTDTLYIARFKWTAPPAGSGDASIYAAMLLTNANGAKTGDAANVIVEKLSEASPSGIRTTKVNNLFSIYPNPAKSNIYLKIQSVKGSKYRAQITSINGKVLINANVNTTAGDTKINISPLAKGVYMLMITDGNVSQSTRFVKY